MGAVDYRIIHATRNEHSQAFTEVCELLLYSLSDLGYDVDISELLSLKRMNIIVGANQIEEPIPSVCKYIVFQLEQLPGAWWHDCYQEILERASAVWDYAPENIEFLANHGIEAKLVTLGYHEKLNRIRPMAKKIDVLFYGSMNERRRKVLEECRAHGLNVQEHFGLYGRDRDMLIAQSKCVLNIHFYPEHICEQVRLSYLFNNAVNVLTERSRHDPYWNLSYRRVYLEELAEYADDWLAATGIMVAAQFKQHYSMTRILKEALA